MRDYLIITLVVASLPIGLFRPFYGLLAYAWISYMYPHELAWSFAQTFPVAKLSALSVMGGLLFTPAGNIAAVRQRENISMLCLWCAFTVSTTFAFYPTQAWYRWQDASKLIIMSVLASMLLRDRQRIRLFLLVIAFSVGFYGFKGGLFGLATGGTQMVLGPGDSIIGANNAIGLALNMCLPMLWYLAREENSWWIKRALQATFFLTIPAIMFTYSRASAIAMAAVLFVLIMRSRWRILLTVGAVVAGVAAIPFIPQKWLDRQQTTLSYEEDGSAMSRIDNWKFCWTVATDVPITGAGFDFQTREVFARYAPEFLIKYRGKIWDTHNIFLGILTSHGFPGLIAFLTMIAFCLASCSRLKRRVRHRPDLRWIKTYSDMIQLSLFAFMLNGMFVNMEYYDLPYHWIAVVASLKVIADRELSQPSTEEEYSPELPIAVAAT
jgi:probable O-glycosylation ligase (exosortase A-associated)